MKGEVVRLVPDFCANCGDALGSEPAERQGTELVHATCYVPDRLPEYNPLAEVAPPNARDVTPSVAT